MIGPTKPPADRSRGDQGTTEQPTTASVASPATGEAIASIRLLTQLSPDSDAYGAHLSLVLTGIVRRLDALEARS